MKIDFHLHTRASFDCDSDPVEIIKWAVKKGLNAVFVTEHDTTDGFNDLKNEGDKHNIFVLPGIEFTVARGTHYLVYLTPELPLPTDDIEMIRAVHRRGGLVGLPHPYRSDTGLVYNQVQQRLYEESEVKAILSQVDFIEVFNAKSSPKQNEQSLLLAERYPQLIRIAGSDSHHPSTAGAAHTDVSGFKLGTIQEMAQQLKTLPMKIIVLAELDESRSSGNLRRAVEGIRRLMVKIKPIVPAAMWNRGKAAYRSSYNRVAEKRATKSINK